MTLKLYHDKCVRFFLPTSGTSAQLVEPSDILVSRDGKYGSLKEIDLYDQFAPLSHSIGGKLEKIIRRTKTNLL